jgi:hypothetical protein
MTTQQFDQERAEVFAERMLGVLNEGAIALMTSIGHRTGLFDAMAGLPPSTSYQIASAARLDERYVREWLAAMVRPCRRIRSTRQDVPAAPGARRLPDQGVLAR